MIQLDTRRIKMALGIVLGIIGIAGVSINYTIYRKMLEKGKARYGADILALAKEIAESEA